MFRNRLWEGALYEGFGGSSGFINSDCSGMYTNLFCKHDYAGMWVSALYSWNQ